MEMKFVESKNARCVAFSKRKKSLFKIVDGLSTMSGANIGALLFSPSGKAYSHSSTSIEEIIDKYLEWKRDNSQIDDQANVDKSNVFHAFDDLREELQVLNEQEKSRKMRYKILHPGAEIPHDKHRSEQLVAIKLRLDELIKEAKSCVLAERLKFDLNVVLGPDEGESSRIH
ncbi:agamous-like MADS-box protein AGL29 [Lycium ferocissimum]|uniref:agamous-like MADS-box protein AGL29 n=1 Tax=Lycium ferocissimum TaxID=112874 RepID=UPI0028164EAB|nr:agamous-like MADS-box protein AGL29 [Lycium ferocissimum]